MFIFAVAVVFKLLTIQFVQGEKYKALATKRVVKNVVIPANRGNVYSVNGNLLATSVPKYDIRFDALTPSAKTFEKYIKPLCDSLSKYKGNTTSAQLEKKLRRARANKNRYYLLARNIGYGDYVRLRKFPLLEFGAFGGGLIVEQTTKREHPMGGIAERTIGYERIDDKGNVTRPGIDGAFGIKYLRGVDGQRKKQKIGKGQWKPLTDANEIEPQDGYDVYTTIDVNIQDIAHHALLEQLEKYKADHGCVVVMETKTGEIRAISNLGRNRNGKYYERLNYAVGESHESGSTFKLMALAAAFEDKVVDTSDVVDTENGVLTFYRKKVRDSKHGGYGKITVSRAFEVSSNTGIVKVIDKAYSKNPEKFVDRMYGMSLNKKLDLPIIGEPDPVIPDPRVKNNRWSGIALQWMAYGYGVSFTPLQTLTFYNAVANNGVMVKPRFLKEVKEFDKVIESFESEVINEKICSEETVGKLQALLKNVVDKEHGTGHKLYSDNFSMAGKTGTCQKNYSDKSKLAYISSFAGYFPADNPKYSCIVVVHEPDKSVGYYGADVSGPVFKKVAQKIFTATPITDEVESLGVQSIAVEKDYEGFYETAQTYKTIMPNLVGMPAMDAIVLLENMQIDVKVQLDGNGVVSGQSIAKNTKLKNNQTVILKAS
ncbi:penicillin-binding protein [Tamlana sp. 2_MG-2023]|uniref:penicillin-binding protein n=1 Tax=unclassified Tamlana TaxID=2614803 RepID=UPI0026E254CB|nr:MULTISPECIES: penicillin-binding protein [unclassified Tamlana]MDO6761602.1 penicillin-binding protein [Tamlana sp. 2_MG-2023]MDO6792426.1 penicillin-binding protein [Tamlana sp. 1_MG-2023]